MFIYFLKVILQMVVINDKEEVEHVISVLRETREALETSDTFKLQKLSDQTIHSASIHQHTDFITLAVLIYSLSKILERKEKMNIARWSAYVKKINDELFKAMSELKKGDSEEFARHLEHTKELLISFSPNVRENVQEVIKRASINKASKIYEHGISLSRTAKLLGITQWELADYVGHSKAHEDPYATTVDEKKRAKIAREFLS